jgi:hypothetical protein
VVYQSRWQGVEVDSFELKGLKINALQAVDLVRLLGVEVEE